ncbi:MAG: hypothetical protein ABSC77_04525 [Terracidiphilus sp.]|jgi:hypothetical protein
MAYNSWGITLWENDKKREFVLILRNSNLSPGASGWQWTSEPMSEEKLRQELANMNVPTEKANAEIAKTRLAKA